MGRSIGKTLGLYSNTHTQIYVKLWHGLRYLQTHVHSCFFSIGFHQTVLTDRWYSVFYCVNPLRLVLTSNLPNDQLSLFVSECGCVFSGRQVTGRWLRSRQALDQTIMTPLLSPLIVYGWIKEPVSRGTHSFSLHTRTEGHTYIQSHALLTDPIMHT